MAEKAFFAVGSKVNVTITNDYVEGDKKTGRFEFEGKYLGEQILGGKTFVGFERTIGAGKKMTTEEFTVNADNLFYIVPIAAPAKEEEDETEAEEKAPAKGKGKGAAADDEE